MDTEGLCELRKNRKESGQALTEYVLLLAIVVPALIYFLGTLSSSFYKTSARYGGSLERQMRTGAAPASIWTK